MSLGTIRVLIVDDSALIRALLADLLAQYADIEVVGKAVNGKHAVDLARELRPHVVILDLQMPVLDGLAALDAILETHPVPVIVFSAASPHGAETALEALDRGAVDFLPKPSGREQIRAIAGGTLVERIRAVAWSRPSRNETNQNAPRRHRSPKRSLEPAVRNEAVEKALASCAIAIGISTGGPPALATLFRQLRPPQPPIFVVQHMPEPYTSSLADRLDALTDLMVREATSGEPVRPNRVYIAPGGHHMRVRPGEPPHVSCVDGPPVRRHKPSIDVLMGSVAEVFGPFATGVIMTGMGQDGVEGCRAIMEAGGIVFGQDAATSVVYGMNKLAFSLGLVQEQFSVTSAGRVLHRRIQELLRGQAALVNGIQPPLSLHR